jgi:hypothetical protein
LILLIKKKLKFIYKLLVYKLFFIFYGRINIIISDSTKILKKNIILDKKLKYRIFSLDDGRLYTDRVHDTAAIIKNCIVDGPSFQYRENKNSYCKNNIVLKVGTPNIKRKLSGTVLSLLTGGGGNANYWHWLLDVLPRLKLASESIDLKNIDYFLLPSLHEKFQTETLDILNIPNNKRLSSKYYKHISADKIIITDHPYNLLNDPFKDSLNIPIWIINFLKEKFSSANKYSENKFPKKFYIDRSDSKSNNKNLRKITNEKDVKNVLEKNGFNSVILSNYHFNDQVKLFNNADHVIGLHGSGFVNVIFCKPKTKITEFRSEAAGEIIKNLSLKNNLNYKSIIRKPESFVHLQLGDIHIPLDMLQSKIS